MVQAGATTRKAAFHVDQKTSGMSNYSDDEDGNRKKYSRRGKLCFWYSFIRQTQISLLYNFIVISKCVVQSRFMGSFLAGSFRHKFLRALLPFWSSSLPTLPVTAPPRKDASNANDAPEGRARHQRPSRMDPRKILLLVAIMYVPQTYLIIK